MLQLLMTASLSQITRRPSKMFLSSFKINEVQSICHISFLSRSHSATDMIQLVQRLEKEVWSWKCSGSLNRENWHSVFVDEIMKQININNRYVYVLMKSDELELQSSIYRLKLASRSFLISPCLQ